MIETEQAFLRAILATPGDSLPRLVYSDWIEEQGRSDAEVSLWRLPRRRRWFGGIGSGIGSIGSSGIGSGSGSIGSIGIGIGSIGSIGIGIGSIGIGIGSGIGSIGSSGIGSGSGSIGIGIGSGISSIQLIPEDINV
jgi:uncharacterized protein (TIGR02996 family)